ncbi:MAG: exonuclease domain-containing protein [Defluviitaleaceae bacterium]|nr:exonuclease domain-containing protein [Defluviitaleaceae bacterium]
MNYIVIDFEYNQSCAHKSYDKNPDCPFEIIQIGAVKLDKRFNVVDRMNLLIKPQIYKRMNPYVRDLTGITEKMLRNQQNFTTVYKDFTKFIKRPRKAVFCVWGNQDMTELFRNINIHNLKAKKVPSRFINVQALASRFLKLENGKLIGLEKAVKSLGLDTDLPFHDAFNDAIYTANIFIKLKEENLTINVYKPKKKVDIIKKTDILVDNRSI